MAFDPEQIKLKAVELAAQGVFLGTSSWKYPGWLSLLYTPSRYEYRGKFATKRFERDCLAEYAAIFKTVCVDAAYYTFPRTEYLQGLADQVPDDFQFGFKITDEITIKKYPNHTRHGPKAGQLNPNYLNADLFSTAFLGPCAAIRPKVGVLMFEFSRFWAMDYAHGRDFLADLDAFLGKLPRGWPYAIELRNQAWLVSEYFACLAKHGVTHVFNSWDAMPPVSVQLALPGSRTNPQLLAARFLLTPGRKYEEAVRSFQPYDKTVEVNEPVRRTGRQLISEGKQQTDRKTFIYVNNRLEGNALNTIAALIDGPA